MGENALKDLGFDYQVIGQIQGEKPAREDTKAAAKLMLNQNAEIIVFIGGDGTACDMYEADIIEVPAGEGYHLVRGPHCPANVHSGLPICHRRNVIGI